jgi:hypothetical protein
MDLKLIIVYLGQRIVLRTLNYQHRVPRYTSIKSADIYYIMLEMISTDSSDTNNYRFQSHINSIEYGIPRYMERQVIQSSPIVPFRNVDSLIIYFREELSTIFLLKNPFTLSE